MLRTLSIAVAEIIAGLFILTVSLAIGALRPELRLLSHLAALGLVLFGVGVAAGVRSWRDAKSWRAQENSYLQSVVRKHRIWRERYVELGAVSGGGELAPSDHMTVHPSMYVLFAVEEQRPASPQREGEREERRIRVDISELVQDCDQLVILGEPGSGKTTCLQWLAFRHAQAALRRRGGHRLFPVLVRLSRYTGSESVLEFLKTYIGDEHGAVGRAFAETLERYLSEGRVFLLLDGLNEFPTEGYAARVDRLRSFAESNDLNKYVLSCRVSDYDYRFGWPTVFVSRLDEVQIETFVRNYLPGTGADLLGQMRESDGALLGLARNPFILRMITLIHQRQGALPAVKARLIHQFVALLLAREKGESWLTTPEAAAALRRLGELALAMIDRGSVATAVDRAWAEEVLGLAGRALDTSDTATPAELLKLGVDATVLDPGGGAQVMYYHELLQEYFAALALKERWEAGEDLCPFVADWWWEPTVAMTCALARQPRDLVELTLQVLGREQGLLLAGKCCVEAGPVLDRQLVGSVLASLQELFTSGIGPLGIKTMDLIAKIDYPAVEEVLLQPDRSDAADPSWQVARLIGGRYATMQPYYMGPFFYHPRELPWSPRAYAAQVVRKCGSARVAELLLHVLDRPEPGYGLHVMAAGALADMATVQERHRMLHLLEAGTRLIRPYAARALGRIQAEEAEPLLTQLLLDDSQGSSLRYECGEALLTIRGTQFLEALAEQAVEPELQGILRDIISAFEASPHRPARWEDPSMERRVRTLLAVDPDRLLDRLLNPLPEDSSGLPCVSFPVAAALADSADESYLPQLEAVLRALPRSSANLGPRLYKLREAIWWIMEVIRQKRRLRGRPVDLSPSPQDWSAFGAPSR